MTERVDLKYPIFNEFEGDLLKRMLKLEEEGRETENINFEERDLDFYIKLLLIKEIEKWIFECEYSQESNFDSHR